MISYCVQKAGSNLHVSLRFCVHSVSSACKTALGLYTVFIEDWFLRFPRDKILVVRLEDVSVDPVGEMSQIFKFLGLGASRLSCFTPSVVPLFSFVCLRAYLCIFTIRMVIVVKRVGFFLNKKR